MFLLLSMLQVMYIHLKCVGFLQSNIWNAMQRGIDAITSCAATIAMYCACSHASRQISLLSCARDEMVCGKKSYEFSVHSLFPKMLSSYNMREKFRKPLNYLFFFFFNLRLMLSRTCQVGLVAFPRATVIASSQNASGIKKSQITWSQICL